MSRYVKTRAGGLVVGRIVPLAPPVITDTFEPECPRCRILCRAGSSYCAECGTRLYPVRSGRYERTR